MKPIHSILFDLDGTLLDTAADLGTALNALLSEEKLPNVPFDAIRTTAGLGSRALLNLGMKIDPTHERYTLLQNRFFEFYEKHLTDQTQFFPGMTETLLFLDQKNISWGIVTNKPSRFTKPLLNHLQLDQRAGCIISGDTLPFHKPHPAPLQHACDLLKCHTENCIYVGDAESDVLASRSANMRVFTALYGYISPNENPTEWKADGYLNHPTDLIQWLL